MDKREIVSLLQLQMGLRLVRVQFLNDSANGNQRYYDYKCATVPDVAINDVVVVEARDTIALARVAVVDVSPAEIANLGGLRHVVCRVDCAKVQAIKEAEHDTAKRLAISEINKQLQEVSAVYGGDVRSLSSPALMGKSITHRGAAAEKVVEE